MNELEQAVEIAFAKFALTYGVAKLENFYRGIPIAEVKASWAHELRGCTAVDVFYALERLPAEGLPNVLQFKASAQRRPEATLVRLTEAPADPRRVAACVEKLQELRNHLTRHQNPRAWIERLEAREKAGEKLTQFQRSCLDEARGRIVRSAHGEER